LPELAAALLATPYAAIPAMVNGAGNAVADTSFVNELRWAFRICRRGVLALIISFVSAGSSTQIEMNVRH
jgi:hypothetical protein